MSENFNVDDTSTNVPVDSSDDTNNETKQSYVTATDFDSRFEALQASLTETLNKAVNGVSKKFNSKLEELTATITTKPTDDSNGEPKENDDTSKAPDNLTISALQKDYDKKLQELTQTYNASLDELKNELSAKEKAQFGLKVESEIGSLLASHKVEELDSARKVFTALYPVSNFEQGEKNIILYKNSDDDDDVTTMTSLVEEWVKSPMGKRFLPMPSIPNGTGGNGGKKVEIETQETDKPKSRTEQVLQKINKTKK